jgi:hypothetical protein
MRGDAVTLGDLASKITMLEVAYSRPALGRRTRPSVGCTTRSDRRTHDPAALLSENILYQF